MAIFGIAPTTLALFIGFGLLIGTLFGFFGMGGSFLVTPALLVLDFPAKVAVGSGLAFVFGTSVIAALRHRNLGQVDYKLGAMFIVGMTVGIEIGKEVVLLLEEMGLSGIVVSASYVFLLATVGVFMFRDAQAEDSEDDETSPLLQKIQNVEIWPMIEIKGGATVSLWLTLIIAVFIGVLSGFLGVGGGFLLMPAMMYLLGVPAAVAVGTDVFQITASGAFGAFTYAQSGSVDLSIVMPLLAGSALGARVGTAATSLVDEDEITGYFATMLLAGAAAVASKEIGNAYGIDLLNTVSLVLIFGSAIFVSGAVMYASAKSISQGTTSASASSH